MKLLPVAAALAMCTAAPAFAGMSFLVDFEQSWAYGSAVDNTYSGAGVTFTNVLGQSNNDGLGPLAKGDYYANAPSPIGVAFAQLDGVTNTAAYMNVASGADNGLSFYYSSGSSIAGAVKAYSGLNGTGTLLGSFNLAATDDAFSIWTPVTFTFSGTAQSFDLSASANVVAFDNISAVPEPETFAMLLSGLGLMAFIARRRNQKQAD
ncbi:MAG: PEP-CTERM sorting domain-containing protein [Rhodoferax sp.]|nr:PEP-CTERM sorting domain-containing protein [Rhodoferax sp.]